jgi:hypothetical protein
MYINSTTKMPYNIYKKKGWESWDEWMRDAFNRNQKQLWPEILF